MHSLAGEFGQEICDILPSFHALTGSDYTNPFFNRSKIQSFRKMLKTPNSHKLLQTMSSGTVDVSEVTNFILHIIYNRPLNEKNARGLSV